MGGKGTFHYMGSIEIITPDDSIRPIKRLKTLPPASEFSKKGNIPLQMYPAPVAFKHIKRVYLQIQIWLGNDVDIDNWGWKHFNSMLIPITMNELPDPDHSLQILFRNCKKGCAAAWGGRKRLCLSTVQRKEWLQYTP
ncbi:uncharacterized protein TNCV_1750491 [Trichonephila clavipes]|nr:uncharacterized protein TNCV_1750491 [Trichonephila clavipes]